MPQTRTRRARLLAAYAFASLASLMLASPAQAGAARPSASPVASRLPIAVSGAWVREAPPSAAAMAGYMTVENRGDRPLSLRGAESSRFGEVQLHEVVEAGGRVRMQQVPGFSIPPGGTLVLRPGGRHLMLMKPDAPMRAGEQLPLVLDFGADGRVELRLPVERRR